MCNICLDYKKSGVATIYQLNKKYPNKDAEEIEISIVSSEDVRGYSGDVFLSVTTCSETFDTHDVAIKFCPFCGEALKELQD